MRFIAVKSVDQQARLSWHRVREGYKAESLAVGNRLRGLLAEFGWVVAQSERALRLALADLDNMTLPSQLKELIGDLSDHWQQLRKRIDVCDARIQAHAQADERCMQVRAIVGVGPLTADAIVASVGSAKEFKNGRQLGAWLGLVPTQHSSGGHTRLGTISCRGDAYLRTLLIQGARSSVQRAKAVAVEKATPEHQSERTGEVAAGREAVEVADRGVFRGVAFICSQAPGNDPIGSSIARLLQRVQDERLPHRTGPRPASMGRVAY